MKKTIVTLIAISSVASAAWTAAEFDKYMSGFIADSGYQAGDSFTLSFVIDGQGGYNAYCSGIMLYLADDWGIFSQAGTYIALENTSVNDRAWIAPTNTNGTIFTWTSTDTTKLDSWVSKSPTGGNANPGISGMTVNIAVTANTGSVITLGMTNGTTSVIETGYIINAKDLILGTYKDTTQTEPNGEGLTMLSIADGGTFTVGNSTYSIPEPTTATLSLLALAGLAARRRRR